MLGRPSIGGRTLAKAITAPKEMYSFPVLTPPEVVAVLQEMGAAATEEDVNKPKPDIFRQWCELFLIDILGISRDELYETHFDFVDALDGNTDLHDGSVPIVHFIQHMNKVLTAARCDEGMSLRDLMKPQTARVLRIMSALINLQKYKIERAVWYSEQQQRKAEALRRKEAVQQQHEQVKRQIAELRAVKEAEQPAVSAAQATCRQLESRRDELTRQLDGSRAAATSTKEDILSLRQTVADLQQRLKEAATEMEATKGQIVSSPMKVKAEIVALEAAAEAEARAGEEAEAHRRLLGRQIEVVAKAEKDVVKAMTLMAEAEAEAVKLKRVLKDEKAKKAEAEALSSEVESLRQQLEHASAQKRRAEEKLQEIREANAARLAAQGVALEAIRRELADYSQDIKASTDARRAAEAEKMRLERSKEALISRHSAEVADMVGSLKRLSAAVGGYHAGLFAGLAALEGKGAAVPAHATPVMLTTTGDAGF